MEKGGGLSHRTPAYNASAAEFYKLYSLQTCSDKPSANNPRKTSLLRPLIVTTVTALNLRMMISFKDFSGDHRCGYR